MSTKPMQTYIQTRGEDFDYKFIGAFPPYQWWLDFRDTTSFEKPTLIIKGDSASWTCYLSGIPSCRHDSGDRIIRYTMVMEGACADAADNKDALRRIETWLQDTVADRNEPGSQHHLGTALDMVFKKPLVEGLLLSASQKTTDESLSRLVLKPTDAPKGQHREGSWLGAMSSKPAQSAFLRRIVDVLDGKQKGFAAWLNLVGKEEVDTLAKKFEGECAVLIEDDLDDDYVQIKKPAVKDKTRTSSPSSTTSIPQLNERQSRRCSQRPPWLLLGGIAVVVLLFVILFLLTSKQSPSENQNTPPSQNSTTHN